MKHYIDKAGQVYGYQPADIECREMTADEFNTYRNPLPTLDEAKKYKLAAINTACDAILNAAIEDYPASEIQTFSQQTAEAEVYVSDSGTETPLLSALSQYRGIPLDELALRVLEKHAAFSMLSGCVIGQRQALEDRLSLCETVDQVLAIGVNITLS